ncbi:MULTISPECIES: hypothetical protein [unclassified Oleiphilus]|uniref:hypothetical protein n=1 Tax=unclassified Oleiphilus TaxID=2631174 RepID=UPI0007C31D4B|nr:MULTISPECIES: hypothetical protein [unclassified Oleiphilus]KZY64096.1 hypothetical protein A3738_11045 [Oleiphilus sp. HI0066]KZY69694.1 hypothetical protein A3739_18960 [Oleiphilus sp. HI0067]KZY69913.1 hypothetical protein A3739_07710 [Oleiphilus sp. HI0067]KZZ55759.1 hypothetical protein A3762_11735 [Oleiphilus sp. HI0125]
MKAKLIALSLLSFGLLMYFAVEEIYFPFILIPFIGFSITVFMWPLPNDESRKRKSQGYKGSDPNGFDVLGETARALKNKRDNESNGIDIDL